MFVQFSDETKTKVVTVFDSRQDEDAFPNQGVVSETDPLWLAYLATTQPPQTIESPQEKLVAFLTANPDVAALVNK